MDIPNLLDSPRRRLRRSRRSWKLSGLETRRGRRLKVASFRRMVLRYVRLLTNGALLMNRNESGTSTRLQHLVYGSGMGPLLSLPLLKVSSAS